MKKILIGLLLLVSAVGNATVKTQQSPAPQNTNIQKQASHQIYDVWLASFNLNLYQDLDNDGYHQNLKLIFDLDSLYNNHDVNVQLWLTGSDGQRQHIYTGQHFELNGDSTLDSQQIDIQFVDKLSSGYYQLEFIVIDQASALTIFTVDQFVDQQLQDLAIEGQHWDQQQKISIYSADIELSNDRNGNGYYQHIAVDIDIDTPDSAAQLVAQFYLNEQLLFTSSAFTITDMRVSDEQYFDIDIKQGLVRGIYDLDIHILDAVTLAHRHHIKALDWVVFQDLALESASNVNDGTIVVDVDQSGGSLGAWCFGLFSLWIGRKLRAMVY